MNEEEVIKEEELSYADVTTGVTLSSNEGTEGADEPVKYNDLGELVPVAPKSKGGSGHQVDYRQQICWDYYVESVTNGQPNILQSAVRAGYSPTSAADISKSKWFKDRKKKFKRSTMLSQAEKNLTNILKMPYMVQKMKNGEPYMEVDTDVLRIVVDVSKAVVKSLGKDEGYSERSEVTGKGGEPIVFMPPALGAKYGLFQEEPEK
jgi:hypothetical protein